MSSLLLICLYLLQIVVESQINIYYILKAQKVWDLVSRMGSSPQEVLSMHCLVTKQLKNENINVSLNDNWVNFVYKYWVNPYTVADTEKFGAEKNGNFACFDLIKWRSN